MQYAKELAAVDPPENPSDTPSLRSPRDIVTGAYARVNVCIYDVRSCAIRIANHLESNRFEAVRPRVSSKSLDVS